MGISRIKLNAQVIGWFVSGKKGFDRTSHLNVFEPLLVDEYQTGLPRTICGVLTEYSSREIIAKIQQYYGEVYFV